MDDHSTLQASTKVTELTAVCRVGILLNERFLLFPRLILLFTMSRFARNFKRAPLVSLAVLSLLATAHGFGPFEDIIEEAVPTGLLTDVPESVNATITALQEELEPVVTGLLSSAG